MGTRRKSLVFAPLGITAILAGSLFLRSQQTDTKPYVLKPIKTFYPVYPEHLKNEGIAGEVIVRVTVNEKGDVEIRTANPIIIKRKLHPELDQLALEAVRQWKFEPIDVFGKAISLPVLISVIFDPGEFIDPDDSVIPEPLSEELTAFLDQGWEYYIKNEEYADYYVCRERRREKIRSLVAHRFSMAMGTDKIKYIPEYFLPDLGEPSRNTYRDEYQITTKDHRVIERRTPVKPPADERTSLFGEKPINSLTPIRVLSRLFAPGYRQEFVFSLGEDRKILGKICRTVEIKAIKRRGVFIKKATAWVEKNGFRLVKAEVEYDSTVIDERLLAECKQYYLAPYMTITCEYEVENKGFLFPSRQEISIEYDHLGSALGGSSNKRGEKANIDMTYDQYRYFSVGTDYKIIK
jgi:TonB family protein